MYNRDQLQLLENFAEQSDKLFSLGIIRTDSFTGEIGEYVASSHFGLNRTDRVTAAVDATDDRGHRYQVKSKVINGSSVSYGLGNLEIDKFDFLVVVYFNEEYLPTRILKIDSKQLSQGKVGISQKLLRSVEYINISQNEICVPVLYLKAILKFGELYNSLIEKKIIRSRRIVGDIGEFYACYHLNLTVYENQNQKGVDAIDSKGRKYEVKTRRVYDSERRKGKSRRLNNLVGKSAESLVVVVLDRSFRCAGMWKMPMANIHNPKSAHLQIVNTTAEVENIVKSKIDWLD
jgi:hypothetical protein